MADPVKVKICGLTHPADAALADELGADYLGVVMTAGFGRSLDPDRARTLLRDVGAVRVAVLVDASPDEARVAAEAIGAGVVQLHGDESPDTAAHVRSLGPWRVWKAVRVRRPGDVEAAIATFAGVVDGLLFEGWKEGVVGGGGVRADSSLLDGVRTALPEGVDFILAGGLTPETVGGRVARLGPSVVDVSSGVEDAPGRKSAALLRGFIRGARGVGPLSERRGLS